MEFVSDVAGGSDPLRPSLFELAASDQLRDLLSPVLRYILSVFAQRNPRYLLRVLRYHDALFALCMAGVERHYLRNWNASFAENFYGLKRVRVVGGRKDRAKAAYELTGRSEKLTRKEINSSLFFLVAVPYLRTKAADRFTDLGGDLSPSLRPAPPLHPTLRQKLDAAYLRLYPGLNVAYELWLLSSSLRYLFERTAYWRPWLGWLGSGVRVRRMSADDYRQASATALSLLSSPLRRHGTTGLPPSIKTIILRSLKLAPLVLFEALKFALPTSIFFFRFLEWWYSPSGGSSRMPKSGAGLLPAFRAPRRAPWPHAGKGGTPEPKAGECVVHGGEVVNPTATPSGWMGCYKCLVGWVEEKGTDPVTGEKCAVDALRKILA